MTHDLTRDTLLMIKVHNILIKKISEHTGKPKTEILLLSICSELNESFHLMERVNVKADVLNGEIRFYIDSILTDIRVRDFLEIYGKSYARSLIIDELLSD